MKQYPHFLYSDVLSESTRDDDGNWSIQTPVPTILSACREETDGRGSEVQSADGNFRKYTSIIYLPKSAADVLEGTVVYVRNSESDTANRIKGPVIKFDRGQLNCRIWV